MIRVFNGERPPRPEDPRFPDTVWILCRKCWNRVPSLRPDIRHILDVLSHASVTVAPWGTKFAPARRRRSTGSTADLVDSGRPPTPGYGSTHSFRTERRTSRPSTPASSSYPPYRSSFDHPRTYAFDASYAYAAHPRPPTPGYVSTPSFRTERRISRPSTPAKSSYSPDHSSFDHARTTAFNSSHAYAAHPRPPTPGYAHSTQSFRTGRRTSRPSTPARSSYPPDRSSCHYSRISTSCDDFRPHLVTQVDNVFMGVWPALSAPVPLYQPWTPRDLSLPRRASSYQPSHRIPTSDHHWCCEHWPESRV